MEDYFRRHRQQIFSALDELEDALDEYDELVGFNKSLIPDHFEELRQFFNELYYPHLFVKGE